MTLSQLSEKLSLTVVAVYTEKEFNGVYAGYLLSRAMSRVKFDNLWLTIMENTNVIAVASLTEAAAVILAEGVELLPEALEAAEEAKQQVEQYKAKLKKLAPDVKDLEDWAAKYTQEPEKVLPKADLLETAATYREKKAKYSFFAFR